MIILFSNKFNFFFCNAIKKWNIKNCSKKAFSEIISLSLFKFQYTNVVLWKKDFINI